MGRLDFGRPAASLIPHHLHDEGDAVDGDAVEGIHHGLPTELEVQVEPLELERADPLGFC